MRSDCEKEANGRTGGCFAQGDAVVDNFVGVRLDLRFSKSITSLFVDNFVGVRLDLRFSMVIAVPEPEDLRS